MKSTRTTDNEGKRSSRSLSLGPSCQVHITTEKQHCVSAHFPDSIDFKTALEQLEQMMHPGDQRGCSGHLAAPAAALFSLWMVLTIWVPGHPGAPVLSVGTPELCKSVPRRSSQMALATSTSRNHLELLCPMSLPSQVKKHQRAMLQLNIGLAGERTAPRFLICPPIGSKHGKPK